MGWWWSGLRLLWLLNGNSDRCRWPGGGSRSSLGRGLSSDGGLLQSSHHLGWIGRENAQSWWSRRRLLLRRALILLHNCGFAQESHLLVVMMLFNFLLLFSMFQDSIDFLFRFLFDLKIVIRGCWCWCRDNGRRFQLILGATVTSGATPLSACHTGNDLHRWC